MAGVEDKEVIFLNDFRWSPLILPWSGMLLLLEGHVVHFAAPKTSYSRDIDFSSDTPIFATSKAPISFVKGLFIDNRETDMMQVRWRFFYFTYQFQPQEQKLSHHAVIVFQRSCCNTGYRHVTLYTLLFLHSVDKRQCHCNGSKSALWPQLTISIFPSILYWY